MNKALLEDIGKLVLRLATGGLMLTHGIPKAGQLLSGDFAFADPIGLGEPISLILTVFAEFICAGVVLVGFKVRLAAIPPIVTMLVAFFIVHGGDPIGKREMALLYLAGFLAVALLGSGRYSVDGLLGNKT